MCDEFVWAPDESAVVFKTVQAVAVYKNTDGDIVIRQQAGPLDDDDAVIVIPRDRVPALASALKAELEGGEDA